MSRRTWARAGLALLAGSAAAASAHAGTLIVRDPAGVEWQVSEDPREEQDGFLLKRLTKEHKPDPAFGRNGVTEFSLGADNDSPAGLRVEASGRVWMIGNTATTGQPLPVIARFNPDGSIDTGWGVQGRLAISPLGFPTRPTDLLPLSDGSVLVAGEAPNNGMPHAIVFKLAPDGRIDRSFGKNGVWIHADTEGSVATNLAVAGDGAAAVALVVRTIKQPTGEVWMLGDQPPSLAARQDLDEAVEEDELRIEWASGRWAWLTTPAPGHLLEPASLVPTPPPASAPPDPGQGAFNPFAGGGSGASAPAGSAAEADDGPPWAWIGVAGALLAGLAAVFLRRKPA